jgi:hypothetical protein
VCPQELGALRLEVGSLEEFFTQMTAQAATGQAAPAA